MNKIYPRNLSNSYSWVCCLVEYRYYLESNRLGQFIKQHRSEKQNCIFYPDIDQICKGTKEIYSYQNAEIEAKLYPCMSFIDAFIYCVQFLILSSKGNL